MYRKRKYAESYDLPESLDVAGRSAMEEADYRKVDEIMEGLAKYKEAVPDDAYRTKGI